MLGAIASGLGGLGAGIAGAIAGNAASRRAERTARRGAEAFEQIGIPREEALRLLQYDVPLLEEALLLDPSQLASYEADPRLRQAQLDALDTLSRISSEGGLDAQGRARMEQVRAQTASQERGAREALRQNMAERGLAGSGLEFAAALQGAQGAADRRALEGLNAQAMNEDRRMQALASMADLGGSMRTQDLGEAEKVSQADEAVRRFNLMNRQDISQRNLAAQNRAREANVALMNQQRIFNRDAAQREFENRMKRAQGISNQLGGAAERQAQTGAQLGQTLGGIGQAAIGAGASIFANRRRDEEM